MLVSSCSCTVCSMRGMRIILDFRLVFLPTPHILVPHHLFIYLTYFLWLELNFSWFFFSQKPISNENPPKSTISNNFWWFPLILVIFRISVPLNRAQKLSKTSPKPSPADDADWGWCEWCCLMVLTDGWCWLMVDDADWWWCRGVENPHPVGGGKYERSTQRIEMKYCLVPKELPPQGCASGVCEGCV